MLHKSYRQEGKKLFKETALMSCKTASSLTPFNTNHGGGNVAHLAIVYHQQILDFLTITKKNHKIPANNNNNNKEIFKYINEITTVLFLFLGK